MISCELLITKFLPAIRRQTAMLLLKKGKTQREIAKELDITEAAVSQYVAKRRASPGDRLLNRIVAEAVGRYDCRKTFAENVCSICRNLRDSRRLCAIHVRDAGKRPERTVCRICLNSC